MWYHSDTNFSPRAPRGCQTPPSDAFLRILKKKSIANKESYCISCDVKLIVGVTNHKLLPALFS
jgi:hypothetical protein